MDDDVPDISGSEYDYPLTTQEYYRRLFPRPLDLSYSTRVQKPIQKQKKRQEKERQKEVEREKNLTELSFRMINDKKGAQRALDFLNETDNLRSTRLLEYLIGIDVEKKYGLSIPLKPPDISKLRRIIQDIDDMMQEEYVEGGHRKRRSKQRRSKKRVSKKRPSKRRTQKRRSKKKRSKKRSKRRNL